MAVGTDTGTDDGSGTDTGSDADTGTDAGTDGVGGQDDDDDLHDEAEEERLLRELQKDNWLEHKLK